MDARRVGLIGGGAAFAVVAALASTFAVSHALTIEDQRGVAVNTPPVVVSVAEVAAPTATPEPTKTPVEVAEPPAAGPPVVAPVEVVTAPKPKPVAPAAPVAPAPPVIPEAPAPVAPPVDTPRPEWPSDDNHHRWTKFASFEEAVAWANEQGWSEQRVRNSLQDYDERNGWQH